MDIFPKNNIDFCKNEDINEIRIIYKSQIDKTSKTKLFGKYFVDKNKYNCKIVIKNKIFDLVEEFNLGDETEIKLINVKNITDISQIFYGCDLLITLYDFDKLDTSKVTDMSNLFYNCKSLLSLPDISKWDTSNVTNMSSLFHNCESLLSLPDISKWNISKVTDMSNLFYNCQSLSSLPDISKWDISSLIYIDKIFYKCKSLCSFPKITNWNAINIMYVNDIFSECLSLSCFPDISKWNFLSLENYSINYFNAINCQKKSIDMFENNLNIFKDDIINRDKIIRENKMTKEEIQKIFDELEYEYNLFSIIDVDIIKFKIIKFKGDRGKLLSFIEYNL